MIDDLQVFKRSKRKYAERFKITEIEAQKHFDELISLILSLGNKAITAQDLLTWAINENHLLHTCFEWTNIETNNYNSNENLINQSTNILELFSIIISSNNIVYKISKT
jgi:hypothetical protein